MTETDPDNAGIRSSGITIKWIREKRYTWSVSVLADDNTTGQLEAARQKAMNLNQQLADDLGQRTEP